MLGKLMKYELRATARYFLPIYGAIIAFSILIGIRGFSEDFMSYLNIILSTALGLSFVGLGVLTLIMVVKRFDSNLMGDEGYLMFTLPVKSSNLIFSKLLTSLIWMFSSTFIFFISMIVITWSEFNLSEIMESLASIELDTSFLMVFILMMIMAAIQFLLQIYASLGIAQAYSITKTRILGGTLVFILIALVFNIIDIPISALTSNLMGEYQLPELSMLTESNDYAYAFSVIKRVLTYSLIYLIIKNIALYFLAKYHLQKKLNLE